MNTQYNIIDIAYEQIKGDYYWAKYGDFKVIMDRETGYINATKLCQLANNGKVFIHWKENSSSKELINELSSSIGKSMDGIIKTVTGGKLVELRGQYVHPDLIPHIASWVSPQFAIKVSKIVNAQLVREYKEAIRNRDLIIRDKDEKIDGMQRVLDEIKTQNDKITRQNDALLTEAREARTEVRDMHEQLDDITTDFENLNIDNIGLKTAVDAIAVRLDIATDDRVPKLRDDKLNEVFVVYHKPGTLMYKTARRQKVSLKDAARYYSRLGYTKQVYYSDSPNAVNLKLRLASILPPSIGFVHNCTVNLLPGMKTDDLIAFIRTAEAEKKNV